METRLLTTTTNKGEGEKGKDIPETGLGVSIGLWDVEVPTYLYNRITDVGKVVVFTKRLAALWP
jgi:hypothetical protein